MGVECWRNTLLLLAALVLAARLGHFQRWGGFQEKSMSKKNMNSTLKFFIENYNNVSSDMYLFRIDKLLQSHMQVWGCSGIKQLYQAAKLNVLLLFLRMHKGQLTTGVEYLVTVKISRTKCRKNSTKSRSCPIQSGKNLKKSFICNFLMYTVPWMNYYQLWNNSCLEV